MKQSSKLRDNTWLKMSIQLSSGKESQVSHFLEQIYQEETSSFLGLGYLLSGWMLKDITKLAHVKITYVDLRQQ